MKLNKTFFILFPLVAVILASCLNQKNNDIDYDTADGRFVSLKFSANDSIPGLENAAFSQEWDEELMDSIIVNLDSLPFQTRIDSVFAKFSFRTTSGAYLVQTKEEGKLDTVLLTAGSTDTLDFTFPSVVYNRSADGTMMYDYPVKVNVHKVEPELYVWKRLNPAITNQPEINQKALKFTAKDKFLFYTGSETETRLYSADGGQLTAASVWTDKGVLPIDNNASLKLRYMTEHGGNLYVADNSGKLYKSADGVVWTQVKDNADTQIYNLLFSLNGSLWAITTSVDDKDKENRDKDFRLAMTTDGTVWQDKGELPQYWQEPTRMFPIDDYAVLVFKSKTGNPKMLVLGGFNKDGMRNRTSWMSGDGVEWAPLRDEALPALQDAVLTQYDDKLFLFGGMSSAGSITAMKESTNEGLVWNTPDSTYNMLPEDFNLRSYQSLILDEEDKRIYLIGGSDGTGGVYSDVWTAKLNRMFFEEE